MFLSDICDVLRSIIEPTAGKKINVTTKDVDKTTITVNGITLSH